MFRVPSPLAFVLAAALALSPAALASFGALPAPAAIAAGSEVTWSVEPVPTTEGVRRTFDYTVDPGTQIVDSVVITNAGQNSAEFLIYATDAINELETGAFSLLKRDVPATDSGSWITTASDTLTLEPGMQAIVPFTLLVPSDATPGDHVAGIVAAVLTKGETDGAAVELEQRVGARVYLTVSGAAEASVELAGVASGFSAEINPFAPGMLDLSFDVRNSGNLRLDVNQTVNITGPFGIPLGEYTPEPLTDLLPRQTVRVSAEIPAIAAFFLAWSSVTLTPGEIGTAGKAVVVDAPPIPAPTESAAALTEGQVVTEEALTEGQVVTEDPNTVDYTPVSATVMTLAVSWTMLAVFVFVLVVVYLVWRYVSGTRERMYLAIDEAEAAARAEALTSAAGVQANR